MLFFDVTKSLFNKVFELLEKGIEVITPIIGSLSVVLFFVVLIGLFGSKSKKKYINEHFLLIVLVICIEAFVSIFFFDLVFVKINLLAITIGMLVLVLKTKTKKRKTTKEKKVLIEEEK